MAGHHANISRSQYPWYPLGETFIWACDGSWTQTSSDPADSWIGQWTYEATSTTQSKQNRSQPTHRDISHLAAPGHQPNAGNYRCHIAVLRLPLTSTGSVPTTSSNMRPRKTGSLTRSESSNDDNIRVASAQPKVVDTSDDEGDPLSDLEKLDRPDQQDLKSPNRTVLGMIPAGEDVEMKDADDEEVVDYDEDDNVTEYSFKSEDYVHDSEMEDLGDEDARSHISLSDDEPEVGPVDKQPWRHMDTDQRRLYERMFDRVFQHPMHGSWTFTEYYHRDMDEQCLIYDKQFPAKEGKWVVPRVEAENILTSVTQRTAFRSLGCKIYGSSPANLYPAPTHNQLPPGALLGGHVVPGQLTHRPGSTPQIPPAPGVNLGGQPMRQPMAFAQQHPYQNGVLHPGMLPNMPINGPQYPMPGQFQQQGLNNGHPNMGPQRTTPKTVRKPKANPPPPPPPPQAPEPPYDVRERPDPRKTPGKPGRGKTRRQAEADEFPWNRQLDFKQARVAASAKETWDDSVYDAKMLEAMARTRVNNTAEVARLEDEISRKQKQSRKKKTGVATKSDPDPEPEPAPEPEVEADASSEDDEAEDDSRRSKGGRKKSRESGSDPYHSGNFAFASPQDQQLASTMGYRSVDELIDAGEADKISMDEMFRIKICWSPGKKGNSQDLEQAKFSVKDTVITRKKLAETPILNHRAGECIIDFCPDLLWRDILLRVLSEAEFSNKGIRDRFCLNGSFSDRATVAKRLGAALGKDTNPPRGEGKEAAAEWCETNRDDFDNYQAWFGKRPPARRTAQGRKKSRLGKNKTEGSDGEATPAKTTEKDEAKKTTPSALDGANDEESAEEESDGEDGQDDAVSMQDSDDLDAMSD